MTTRLILARHGNTFKPEDRPVWIGGSTDLPLVDKGIAQAHEIAEGLKRVKITPAVIASGPLRRQMETARIVATDLGLSPDAIRSEETLRELDYGTWEGKSTDEIIAMGGGHDLDRWEKLAIYPFGTNWRPMESQVTVDVLMLLALLPTDGHSLLVTSNGILRIFASITTNAADLPDRKVATGNMCVIEGGLDEGWKIMQWNKPPHLLDVK